MAGRAFWDSRPEKKKLKTPGRSIYDDVKLRKLDNYHSEAAECSSCLSSICLLNALHY